MPIASRESVRLNEILGTGYFGSVYRGTFRDAEEVAVKVISPNASGYTLFLVALADGREDVACPEARMMMEFQHPNVVSCLLFMLNPTWIVMELCSMNLNTFFCKNGWRMTEGERLDVMGQVNRGLVAIHGKGIVHRDIKASNVMVKSNDSSKYGVVYKIGDFGLASKESDNANDSEFRAYCKYRAPELKDGKCTTKVDMWNLGLIFYSLHARGIGLQQDREISRDEIDRFLQEVSGDRIRLILTSLLDKDADKRMDSRCVEEQLREEEDCQNNNNLFSSLERALCRVNSRRILEDSAFRFDRHNFCREILFVFILSPFLRLLREGRRRRGGRRRVTETIYMSIFMTLSLMAFIVFTCLETYSKS